MSTTGVAASLDYADPSAFNRAFRRWTNSPPAAWRAKARSDPSMRPERESSPGGLAL
jgi:AraC-like DNA-binding protein